MVRVARGAELQVSVDVCVLCSPVRSTEVHVLTTFGAVQHSAGSDCVALANAAFVSKQAGLMSKLTPSGDPKRPDNVHPFDRNFVSPTDSPADDMHLVAMIFGVSALLLKLKGVAWASILCVMV